MKSQGPIAALMIIVLIIVGLVAYKTAQPLTPVQLNIFKDVLLIAGAFALYCFVVGELTKNVSQVDKLWSIVPIVYSGYIAFASDFAARPTLVAVLIAIWGIRLSYNFSRRGGYTWKFWVGEEDYRWAVLRKDPKFSKPWVWSLFNLFFICGYQMALILYFTLPVLLTVDAENGTSLKLVDYILAAVILGLIAVETIADQQQYNFQTKKYELKAKGETLPPPYDKGFITSGLWSKMRHPNYAAEQAIWVCVYLFSVIATGQWINWTLGGVVLLIILFKGSSDFSEAISSEKYPEYAHYKKQVSRFLPF